MQPELCQTLIRVSISTDAVADTAKIETTVNDSSITMNTVTGMDADTKPAKTEQSDPVALLGGDWRTCALQNFQLFTFKFSFIDSFCHHQSPKDKFCRFCRLADDTVTERVITFM